MLKLILSFLIFTLAGFANLVMSIGFCAIAYGWLPGK